MGLERLAGRGLAGWVQGGAGRGGFCKGDMAEWTQELETFAGASVSSGEKGEGGSWALTQQAWKDLRSGRWRPQGLRMRVSGSPRGQ